MNSYHHFSPEERAVIMLLLKDKVSIRGIAKEIDRHPSSYSREIKRNRKKSILIALQAQLKPIKNAVSSVLNP